jgi:hypothetical protein
MAFEKIIVPFDLLEDSYPALSHAACFANKFNAEICLLHLVSEESEIDPAMLRLHSFKERLSTSFAGKISTLVEKGSILRDFSAIAIREKSQLVIIPTHGIKGMQHIKGSNALRIVTDTKLPFLVTQERNVREHGYKIIAIPVAARNEILDEASFFVMLSKMFNSEVHLFANTNIAEQYNAQVFDKLELYFAQEGANVKVTRVNENKSFTKSFNRFAASIDADLICAINFSYQYLYTLFPRVEEEDFIYNDSQIPVLMITPEKRNDWVYQMPFIH